MQNNQRFFKAFSLAEALIAMSIIAVVALLVVPVMKKYTSEKVFVTQLKKNYNVLNSSLDNIFANDFDIDINKMGGTNFFLEKMVQGKSATGINKGLLSYVRTCNESNMYDTSEDELNGCFGYGVADVLPVKPINAVVLVDGSTIANNDMIYIVDVNASSPPNQMGVDIFSFELKKVKGDYQDANANEDDGSESGAEDDTFTAGWRFVPLNETKEVIDNNWKIKEWD